MELLQLKYFCTIAQMESISNAASFFNVSQPSLSKTIIKLENELGIPLFDRVGRKIKLNYQGNLYYNKIVNALNLIDSAKNELSSLSKNPQDDVSILVLVASYFMPELITSFARKYPLIHINLSPHLYHDLSDSMEYDFHISSTPMDYSQLQTVLLLEEEIVIIASASSQFFHNKTLIDLNEAAECDFITYSHGPINKSPSTRIQFENLCYLSGFTPKIKYECDTPETLIEMVSADLGVSLIPTNTLMQCKKKNISVIHLSNHGMSRMIYLSWHKEKYMSTACKFFKQHCMEFFRQKTK